MRLRAVTYCRCSTEEESQRDALEKQVKEARDCVNENGWLFVDSYVESRSGTSTKNRTEYNRLYEDLLYDKFDIIVIKSQDRLMRNTKDWYLFVDRLSTSGKKLYIYIERKFYTPDDALITGIKAILAEDYSRELSKKINNAHRNRQKKGGTPILTSNTYGYRKLPDKSVVIIEEEAEIKRRMYELCAAGYGSRTISSFLQNDGIYNRRGKPFCDTDILRIIRNPLNKGTVVMNRRHYDFDSKKIIQVPEEEQFVYENMVPAIVSEELWERANQAITDRVMKKKPAVKHKGGKNPGKYQLSGKLICGLCNNPYYRVMRRRYKDKTSMYEWKCKCYLESGRSPEGNARPKLRQVQLENIKGCDNIHLQEDILYELLEEICTKRYVADKEKMISRMLDLLKTVLREKDDLPRMETAKKKTEEIRKKMIRLVDKLLEGVLSDDIYRKKQKELEQQLEEAKKQMDLLERKNAGNPMLRSRISEIEDFLKNGSGFEKATVRGMLDEIEEIRIFPSYMEIVFNAGKLLNNTVRVEYGNKFSYLKKKQEAREIVVEMMKKNPSITAKEIAKELDISLSGANYKIRALKKEGRIRYNGRGGKGRWEVMQKNGFGNP